MLGEKNGTIAKARAILNNHAYQRAKIHCSYVFTI